MKHPRGGSGIGVHIFWRDPPLMQSDPRADAPNDSRRHESTLELAQKPAGDYSAANADRALTAVAARDVERHLEEALDVGLVQTECPRPLNHVCECEQ
eukprot:scaffold144407_cov34-Tisochrysis_lutea.AAC.1